MRAIEPYIPTDNANQFLSFPFFPKK